MVTSNSPAMLMRLTSVRVPPISSITPGWIAIVWFGVTLPV